MKKPEDLICIKISECQKHIEMSIKTSQFSPEYLSKMLVEIQRDAIRMEEGLSANKVLRLKHGIDAEYREMMKDKAKPTGINELAAIDLTTKENGHTPKYELTLTDNKGKVLYQNKLFAFLLCAVERISNVDAAGMIEGQVQTLAIGQDMAVWYAWDQLRQKFAGKINELMLKMAGTVKSGKLLNRKDRRTFVKAANGQKFR